MKNLIKKSLLVATLVSTMISKATEKDLFAKLISSEKKLIQLFLQNHDGPSEVYLKDTQGVLLYKEKFEDEEFSNKFDLAALPTGTYFFEINGQTKIRVLPFMVSANNVEFIEEATTFFKPIVRFKNDIVYVSKFTLTYVDLNIFLYDDDNNLIYNNELSGDSSLALKLNISNLDAGSYNLVLKSGGKMFNEIIEKK